MSVRDRRLIIAGLILIVLSIAVIVFTKNSPDAGSRSASPVAGLACAPGELRGANHRDLDPNFPGATTPQIALSDALAEEMPSVKVPSLVQTLLTSSSARYALVQDGKTQAEFSLVNLGAGWRYAGWSACESFANKHLVRR